MPKHLLRPLLIVEFLIAIEVTYTTWSEVGGQYDLDLMFWPWKLGVGVAVAWLITAITGNIVKNDGAIKRRVLVYASLLCLVVATAGVVTWYYHIHEPVDQQDQDDDDDDSVTPAARSHSSTSGWSPAAHRARDNVRSPRAVTGCPRKTVVIPADLATVPKHGALQLPGRVVAELIWALAPTRRLRHQRYGTAVVRIAAERWLPCSKRSVARPLGPLKIVAWKPISIASGGRLTRCSTC